MCTPGLRRWLGQEWGAGVGFLVWASLTAPWPGRAEPLGVGRQRRRASEGELSTWQTLVTVPPQCDEAGCQPSCPLTSWDLSPSELSETDCRPVPCGSPAPTLTSPGARLAQAGPAGDSAGQGASWELGGKPV